jgi:hypothetical protein
MATSNCASCTYYEGGHTNDGRSSNGEGLCRYNPPVSQPGPDSHGLWPVVGQSDWCGHHSTQAANVQHR